MVNGDLSYLADRIIFSKNIIKEAIERFGDRMGIGWSGGSDSTVLLSLVLPLKWNIPVLYINTTYDFPETSEYIDNLAAKWKLNLHTFSPSKSIYDLMVRKYGEDTENLYYNCCIYHKVEPMMRGIKELNLDAFLVGIRGVEHPERAKEQYFSYHQEYIPPHYRVHPLLDWTRQEIVDYMLQYNIPINPLYNKGYTSLGCIQCTKKNLDPNAHERTGRARKRELIKYKLKKEGYN